MSETTAIAVPTELVEEGSGHLRWAHHLAITGPEQYEQATQHLISLKVIIKRVEAFFSPLKRKADEAKKAILDAEKEVMWPLVEAEDIAKDRLLAYQQEEKARANRDRERLQAQADERARRERERLQREAARLKTPERKEERLERAAAVIAPVIHVPSAVPKIAGTSTRTHWVIASIDKATLVRAAAHDETLMAYLTVDETALRRTCAARGGDLNVPGVTFREEEVMAVGGRQKAIGR